MQIAASNKHHNNLITRPTRALAKDITQHGSLEPAYLLAVPDEALMHITSFCEPPALLQLGQTNRQLHGHVSREQCWLRAFLVFFLNIGPEASIETARIRRIRPTWREEFISRFKLVKRWQRSRAASVTHVPQWAPISSMHLMVDGAALLSASLAHGVVARSNAISGKRLKSFIDSFGALVQRPTGDHPIPSCMALASDGGTGKAAWGYFGGTVALTRMPHVMDMGTPRTVSCGLADAHTAPTTTLSLSAGGHILASGAQDGSVRLWDTRRMRALWAYTPDTAAVGCTKIALDLPFGALVVAMHDGSVKIWSGFAVDAVGDTCSTENVQLSTVAPPDPNSTLVLSIALDPTDYSVAVLYSGSHIFYKSGQASQESSHGLLTCMQASFASSSKTVPAEPGPKLIFTGDKAGWLHVWDWDTLSIVHAWQAHDDGAVTALELADNVFASGNAHGAIAVWDRLTYEPLRTFATPVPRAVANNATAELEEVTQLELSDAHVVGCVSNRVIAWRVQNRLGFDLAGKRKAKSGGTARYFSPKWQDQLEIRKAIHDSHDSLDVDYKSSQRRAALGGRQREQRTALDSLGLEEVEALEYVLMLSREEEEMRQRSLMISESVESTSSLASNTSSSWSSSGADVDRATLSSGDSPPLPPQEGDDGEPVMFALTPVPSPPRSPIVGPSTSTSAPIQWPHAMPSPGSNRKVQVTPPFRPEPMAAGSSPGPLSLLSEGAPPVTMRRLPSQDEFPKIKAPSPGSSPGSTRKAAASKGMNQPKAKIASPVVPTRSWSAVTRQGSKVAQTAPTKPNTRGGLGANTQSPWKQPLPARAKAEHRAIVPQSADEEAEMIRLALESSLAEQ